MTSIFLLVLAIFERTAIEKPPPKVQLVRRENMRQEKLRRLMTLILGVSTAERTAI